MKNRNTSDVFFFSVFLLLIASCSEHINSASQSKIDSTQVIPTHSSAKSVWKELHPGDFKGMDSLNKRFTRYKLFELDSLQMQALLQRVAKEKIPGKDSLKVMLQLPRPDSGFMEFQLYSTSTMAPELEKRFPLLKSFGGQGINDRTATLRVDFNTNGFHAYVISEAGEWIIQPLNQHFTHQFLTCFFKQDVISDHLPFELPDSLRK